MSTKDKDLNVTLNNVYVKLHNEPVKVDNLNVRVHFDPKLGKKVVAIQVSEFFRVQQAREEEYMRNMDKAYRARKAQNK